MEIKIDFGWSKIVKFFCEIFFPAVIMGIDDEIAYTLSIIVAIFLAGLNLKNLFLSDKLSMWEQVASLMMEGRMLKTYFHLFSNNQNWFFEILNKNCENFEKVEYIQVTKIIFNQATRK